MTQDSPLADPWEAAYLRFETPVEERRKFIKRLRTLGVDSWPRDGVVVELFCGRGNGLHALATLGFSRLIGLDLSRALAEQYQGPASIAVTDCRQAPLASRSVDVAIVQGGLHHLPTLPGDLERTLSDVQRMLKPEGRFVIVEPWLTPFLSLAHAACDSRAMRHLSARVDALATMIEHERRTYEQWLAAPRQILDVVERHFALEQLRVGWGKLMALGRPRHA